MNKIFFEQHIGILIEVSLILIITFLLMKVIDFLDKKIRENIIKKHENSARLLSFCPILNKVIKTIILFIIIASVMQSHGYSMASLVAGFGIMGMAVSFAAKESIANIFGSISILYDKVFDLGDYIKINDVEGFVNDISLRSTKIRTLDNSIITIPNNVVANSVVINYSAIEKRRMNEVVSITYGTSDEKIDRAIEIIKSVIRNNDEIVTNDNLIFLEKLNSSSIDIHLEAYINHGDLANFRRVRQDAIKAIVKQFRQEGINFAFPSQSVYIENNEN